MPRCAQPAMGVGAGGHRRRPRQPRPPRVAVGGDGDGFGIGMGHFIHAMRRNLNLTTSLMDNGGLRADHGQASPHHHQGHKTRARRGATVETPIQPLASPSRRARPTWPAGSRASPSSSRSSSRGRSRTRLLPHRRVQPLRDLNKINTYRGSRSGSTSSRTAPYDPTDLMARHGEVDGVGLPHPDRLLYRHESRPTRTPPVLTKGAAWWRLPLVVRVAKSWRND